MKILSKEAKILIIRFSSLGDILLTTPIIRCIRQQLKCRVDFLTKEIYTPVLANNPNICKLHQFKNDYTEILRRLKSEDYDLIIDLHKNIRSLRLSYSLRVHTIRFNKENLYKWLRIQSKRKFFYNSHIVDRYFGMLKDLGIVNDAGGLEFFVSDSEIKRFSETYSNILPPLYNTIQLGAHHFTKRIPTALAEKIILGSKLPVVLLGGEDVKFEGDHLEMKFGQKLYNLTGKTNLAETALILKNTSHLVTGDTGIMHLGAALKKSMSVIWGSTDPHFGMGPYYGKSGNLSNFVEVKGLSCRPCSKLGKSKCPKKHFDCMKLISANNVISKMNDENIRN